MNPYANLEELIAAIQSVNTAQNLKDMVIGYVKVAHCIGWEQGMKEGAEVACKTFEMVLQKGV